MTVTFSVSPMGSGFQLTLRLIWLLVAHLLTGCSGAGDIQGGVAREIEQVFNKEIMAAYENGSHDGIPAEGELSISRALELALVYDTQLKPLGLKYRKSQIEIDQAESVVWPRFTADANAQIPINGDGLETKSDVSAGIFLRYDIMQAIFFKDLTAVGTAQQKRSAEHIALEEKKVFYRLMRLLCRADYRMQAATGLDETLTIVRRERHLMDEARRPGAEFKKQLETVDAETDTLSRDFMEHRARHDSIRGTLQRMMGLPGGHEIKIAGFREQFPDPETFEAGALNNRESLSSAWRQRNDLRMTEFDLFIAEMGILSAKRSGLPRVSASLGIGHILLESNGDNATLVPSFSVSVPLLDMGDVKRQVQRAEIERDSARMQLAALARNIVENFQETVMQSDLAAKRMNGDRRQLQKASRRLEDLENLAAAGRTGAVDICLARLEKIKAELRWLRTQLEFREAYLDVMETLGASLQENSRAGDKP